MFLCSFIVEQGFFLHRFLDDRQGNLSLPGGCRRNFQGSQGDPGIAVSLFGQEIEGGILNLHVSRPQPAAVGQRPLQELFQILGGQRLKDKNP